MQIIISSLKPKFFNSKINYFVVQSIPNGNGHSETGDAASPRRKFDFVFFDWKGTLSRKSPKRAGARDEARVSQVAQRLRHFHESGKLVFIKHERNPNGTAPSDDDFKEVFHRSIAAVESRKGKKYSWNEVLDTILIDLKIELVDYTIKEHLQLALIIVDNDHDKSGLYDGAEEIVRWLREDYGVRLGLIRNSKASENAMRVRMRRAGIDDRQFDVVVMGGERSYAKPDPELFIEAAKQAGITDLHVESPARIAYIGNEVEADVKGALSVKWTSILVKHTEPSSGGLAHYELDNLLQLKSVAWHE